MNRFEELIDRTEFGTVAGYLRRPNSPIQYALHVKERDQLALLAEVLDRELERGGFGNGHMPEVLHEMFAKGTLRYSSHEDQESPADPCRISALAIAPTAQCEVIYLEPFYLVHTPGLFEGKHDRDPQGKRLNATRAGQAEKAQSVTEEEGYDESDDYSHSF
ncbi:MAG: hypothetical protein AB9869_03755 [Verrucomicrobiia bacterium]